MYIPLVVMNRLLEMDVSWWYSEVRLGLSTYLRSRLHVWIGALLALGVLYRPLCRMGEICMCCSYVVVMFLVVFET